MIIIKFKQKKIKSHIGKQLNNLHMMEKIFVKTNRIEISYDSKDFMIGIANYTKEFHFVFFGLLFTYIKKSK